MVSRVEAIETKKMFNALNVGGPGWRLAVSTTLYCAPLIFLSWFEALADI